MKAFKKVKDIYDREVVVDYANRKLVDYSNADEKITYNAEIIKGGEHTGFYTDFEEAGIVMDVEERLKTCNNVVRLAYAKVVDFEASKNDPKGEIWDGIVEIIKKKPSFCFDENGDFKEEMTIDPKDFVDAFTKAMKYDKMTRNLSHSDLSAEERSAAARKAVNARWAKKKKGGADE